MAVGDATMLAYLEVLVDEQKPRLIGYPSCAIAWFNSQGIECRRVKRQLARLCLQGIRKGLPQPGPQSHPHQALDAPQQRQGGEVYSDPL